VENLKARHKYGYKLFSKILYKESRKFLREFIVIFNSGNNNNINYYCRAAMLFFYRGRFSFVILSADIPSSEKITNENQRKALN